MYNIHLQDEDMTSQQCVHYDIIINHIFSIKIPQLRMSVDPGANSNGYISNVEGLINRFKKIVEEQRDNADDKDIRKKAKNLLKKIRKVEYGEAPLKIVITVSIDMITHPLFPHFFVCSLCESPNSSCGPQIS